MYFPFAPPSIYFQFLANALDQLELKARVLLVDGDILTSSKQDFESQNVPKCPDSSEMTIYKKLTFVAVSSLNAVTFKSLLSSTIVNDIN